MISKSRLFVGYISYFIIQIIISLIIVWILSLFIPIYYFNTLLIVLMWLLLNYSKYTKQYFVKLNVLGSFIPLYYILKKHKTISKLRKHFYKLYYSGVVIEYELYGDFKDIKMIISNKNIHYKQIHFNIFQYKSWINLLKQRYEDTWYCMFIFNKIPKSGYMKLSYL